MKTCKPGIIHSWSLPNGRPDTCEHCGLHFADRFDACDLEAEFPPVRPKEPIYSCQKMLQNGRVCNYPTVKRMNEHLVVWCNPDGSRHEHQTYMELVRVESEGKPELRQSTGIELAKKTIEERAPGYGPFVPGAEALGKIWAGILQDATGVDVAPLSARTVMLMMTALKLSRAARPFKFNLDDYVDGHAYLHLAEQCPKAPEKKP